MTTSTDSTAPTTDEHDTPEALDAPRAWAAGHVLLVVVLALVLAGLFNARDLLATAERQPFGWQRDVAVAFASPLVTVSNAFGFDEPRNAIDQALGRGSLQPADAPAEPTDTPTVAPTPAPTASAASTPTPTPSPSQEITATNPLQMYIGGDSMVEIQFGTALADVADDTGLMTVGQIDFDRGSGLSRPDFVDWPARLATVVAERNPEVMVLWFGGNDAQPLKLDGVVYQVSDPQWQAEYRQRVSDLMDQLDEAGIMVYWMGLPIPRDLDLQTKWRFLDDIYESEAASRKATTYIRMWELFTGDDGKFSEYLPNRNGDVVDMRLNDGIHLTTAGAYRAARVALARIIEDFGIEPEPEG
ncbi:MAG: hypothetical protein ACI867_002475 [Glaciecola sp.]|jgi:hypothetical protein